MSVIFDLDLTLVNSKASERMRDTGKWSEALNLIPTCLPYEGINEIIRDLNRKNIKIAINFLG